MGSGQALEILQRQKDAVSLADVALYSGVIRALNVLDIRAVEDSATQYAVAQAILDNIATHESSLVIRDIFQDKDLLTGTGAAITRRQWRQPTIEQANEYITGTSSEADATAIYTTGKNVDFERKVYVFYGYGLAGTGPSRAIGKLKSVSWIWKRAQVKVIDVHQIQHLETADPQIILFRTPILLKARDNLRVEVIPNTETQAGTAPFHKFDEIILYAKVVEAIGQTMVG